MKAMQKTQETVFLGFSLNLVCLTVIVVVARLHDAI